MVGRLVLGAVVLLLALFGAAQLVRPARTNPPIDPARTIEARFGASSPLAGVLARACGDCHSNATVWSRYSQIAPLSWAIASGVSEGRKALNVSDWAAYSPDQQRALLGQSCADARDGKMPPSVFVALRPEARLSPADVQTICAAADKP